MHANVLVYISTRIKDFKKGPAIKGSSIRKHSIFNMQGKQDPFGAF